MQNSNQQVVIAQGEIQASPLITHLNLYSAQCSGIAAIANQAIDNGQADLETLGNIALLAEQLDKQLQILSNHISQSKN